MEQPWFERQLLVSLAQLADERQEPELQLRGSEPAEQQQQVQRLYAQGGAALIKTTHSDAHNTAGSPNATDNAAR